MGNNKKEKFATTKTGGGCACGNRSGGYRCGKNCKNKRGGRTTCCTNGSLCGTFNNANSLTSLNKGQYEQLSKEFKKLYRADVLKFTGNRVDFRGPDGFRGMTHLDGLGTRPRRAARRLHAQEAGRRSKKGRQKKKNSKKKSQKNRNKTRKGRRKIRTRKGGVWPFNPLFGSNNNTQNSQDQYPENNVVLPPMQFGEPQPNIARPPTPPAMRSYASYSPTARRNNRRMQAQPARQMNRLTQTQQYQLERMNHEANTLSGPLGEKQKFIKAGNTEAVVRERINQILGTLDTYMGRIFERQLQVNCSERGHTLYMNTLYVFIHHVIQILLTPTVSNLAQMLIGSSSNFIVKILSMIKRFFSEQVASTGEINESFLLIVSWFIRTMGTSFSLAMDLSKGPVLFSNFVIAIMNFLQETTVNMTTTTIIPLGVFIYLVYNTFIYSYMKVLDRTDKLVKYMGPILSSLGITIDKYERMTIDEIKDTIRNSVWDYIVTNSPVGVVLRRDVLDGHIARICQSAINKDYILWMLQTSFGEHVSRQSHPHPAQQPTATPLSPLIPPQDSPRRSPMAFGQAPPMAFGQAQPMAPPMAPPMAQHTPYPTHPENNQMNNQLNSYDYDKNFEALNARNVTQLKAILKKSFLDITGKKKELIDRILESGWSL